MLWTLFLALIISLSGLRKWLDPTEATYVLEIGWLVNSLIMLTNTTGKSAGCKARSMYDSAQWRPGMRLYVFSL